MTLSLSMSFSDFNTHMILSSILQTLDLKTYRSPNSLSLYNNYQASSFRVSVICTFSTSKVLFIKTKHLTKNKNKRKG